MKAYQIRLYEFPEGASSSTVERTVIALLTPKQRDEMFLWLKMTFGDRSVMVPYDLHNFATAKDVLLVARENLVAGAIWPNAPQGTIPVPRKRKVA